MSTKIVVKCKNCSCDFDYAKKELNRQIKKGRTIYDLFCSRSCNITFRNKNLTDDQKQRLSKQTSTRNTNNTYNKKGNFTFYLKKINERKQEVNIDEEYISNLWDKQGGKCALSKIDIHLKNGNHKLNTASLDRIDSSKGYIKGNVQFVAYAINLAKNKFSDEDLKSLLQNIVESY